MKKQQGITLITLVITIAVMSILAGVATYSGIKSINETKRMAFISELEMIQTKVNSIYEKIKLNEEDAEYYNNLGTECLNMENEKIETALGQTSKDGFRYLSTNDLRKIGLDNINQEVLINYETREVVSITGIEIDGVKYYKLKDIPNYLGYNVEYTNTNMQAPTFSVEKTKIFNSYRFTVKDIVYNSNVTGGTVSYKLHSDTNWVLNGENTTFEVKEPGLYDICFTDVAGNSKIIQEYIYVEDNLIMHLDGENNTGAGHSNNTTTWKDLSNTGNDRTLINFDTTQWNEKSLQFDGINDYLNDLVIDNTEELTIQVTMNNDKTDIYRNIYDKYYAEDPMLWLHPSSKFEFSKSYVLDKDYSEKNIVVTNVLTTKTSNMFVNLEEVLKEFGHNKEIEGTYQLFNRKAAQTYKGKIYSVRIYKRALTYEEIQINYEIDKYRFNIDEI